MSDYLKHYQTSKGIIQAWFLDVRLRQKRHPNGSCYNVRYGYEGQSKKVVSEPVFLAILKRNNWKLINE